MKLDVEALASEAFETPGTEPAFRNGFYTVTKEELKAFTRLIVERCAVVCDRRYMGDNNREDMEARKCAAAIRNLLED